SRGYGQTAFDIGQCRRDCPQFRALEDRVGAVAQFFMSARPHDLKDVRMSTGTPRFDNSAEKAKAWVENEAPLESGAKGFGPGAVQRGATLFAAKCASCHSSQPSPAGGFESLAGAQAEQFFLKETDDPFYSGKKMRVDWMGNDQLT